MERRGDETGTSREAYGGNTIKWKDVGRSGEVMDMGRSGEGAVRSGQERGR